MRWVLSCSFFFFFSSRRRHTRFDCDWSSDVCSSDLALRLLKLPAGVLALLHEGGLSVGHARAVLALDDPRAVATVAKEAVDLGLSVRDVEDRVRGGRAPVRRPRLKQGLGAAPEVRRIEDALRRRLGTDVRVTLRAEGKGQIHVNFYSNDDLARLLELILGAPFDG